MISARTTGTWSNDSSLGPEREAPGAIPGRSKPEGSTHEAPSRISGIRDLHSPRIGLDAGAGHKRPGAGTLTPTARLLIGAVVLTVGVSVAVAAATHQSPGSGGGQDPTKLALTGVILGSTRIAVIAVLSISEEYATGMIRTTLTAIPRRLALLEAKAVNLAGLTLVAGVLGVAGCLLAGRLLLPAAGFDPAHGYALVSIGHGPTLRAAAGGTLYLVLIALLALGVATAIRDTAVSIGAVLALLYLPPLLAQVVSGPLRRHIEQIAPMTAGLAIQATTNRRNLPIAPWAGLGVLAAWATAFLLIAGALLRSRDA
jgi:ABC-2 type transport system permease protein